MYENVCTDYVFLSSLFMYDYVLADSAPQTLQVNSRRGTISEVFRCFQLTNLCQFNWKYLIIYHITTVWNIYAEYTYTNLLIFCESCKP